MPLQAEAALAQSDFNIDKILEIQNKFTGGTVGAFVLYVCMRG